MVRTIPNALVSWQAVNTLANEICTVRRAVARAGDGMDAKGRTVSVRPWFTCV
jgi:hypothetical protein